MLPPSLEPPLSAIAAEAADLNLTGGQISNLTVDIGLESWQPPFYYRNGWSRPSSPADLATLYAQAVKTTRPWPGRTCSGCTDYSTFAGMSAFGSGIGTCHCEIAGDAAIADARQQHLDPCEIGPPTD